MAQIYVVIDNVVHGIVITHFYSSILCISDV